MNEIDTLGNPICEPLDTLKDLVNWSSSNYHFCKQPVCRNNVSIRSNRSGEKRPQVLVCHDMKGGYLDDRFIQGSKNALDYRFYHWHLIDTFIYFSHRFITIPPVGWIHAAHKNGVQILGTLITESCGICEELLASRETIDVVAEKLAEIAVVLGLDGWFINIENKIEEERICDLQYFVQQVTSRCHSRLENLKVLWYDSVICNGHLSWQNELNKENEMFFSVCDGIFLNYNITPEGLADSRKRAEKSNRQFDVYAGVDVFGRGSPGGGGFGCETAVKMIFKEGLSFAMFAQGWVYEVLGAESFDANENKFWRLLKDYFPVRSVEIPFCSSFCQGFGQRHFLRGKVVSEKPWHNLCLQQLQPCCYDDSSASLTTENAYNGGGCLKLTTATAKGLSMIRLFKINLHKNETLALSSVWKDCGGQGREQSGLALVFLPDEKQQESLSSSSEKAIVLTHEGFMATDRDSWLHLLPGNVGGKAYPKESMNFITGVHSEGQDNEWKNSVWHVNIIKIKDTSSHLEGTLYAVVVPLPRDPVEFEQSCDDAPQHGKENSILLGYLQVSSNLPDQKSVSRLEAEKGATSLEQKSSIVTSVTVRNIEELKTMETFPLSPEEKESLSCSKPSFAFKNCHITACEGTQSFSLHVLNWTTCDDDHSVDYYILSSLDNKGSEHFVGCTRFKSFVVKRCNGNDLLPPVVAYSIQPVMNDHRQMAQKLTFSL